MPEGLTIEVVSGSGREREAASVLESISTRWDLAKFLYTKRVRVDDAAANAFSHPVLTIPPRDLAGPAETSLAILVHEQMHWASTVLAGTDAAIAEVRRQYPTPPGPPGGATDPESTWLHFPVCALTLVALGELIGEDAARAVIAGHPFYTWIHRTLIDNPAGTADYMRRHGLTLPALPPEWDPPGVEVVVPGGLTVIAVSGHPRERVAAATIGALHQRFDLRPWANVVEIEAMARPSTDPVPRLCTRTLEPLALLAHYLEPQAMWRERSRGTDPLPADLEMLVPPVRPGGPPTETLRAIVAACAETFDALNALLDSQQANELTGAHPLNADLYRDLARVRNEPTR